MKKPAHLLFTFVGHLLFAGAFALSAFHVGYSQKAPPPVNAKVINTSSEPVPVTGSVNVSGPVTVTGSVSVSNQPATPLLVRDVDNPARNTFIADVTSCTIPEGSRITECTVATAPQGKQLVIEFVSIAAFMPAGQKPLANTRVSTVLSGVFNFPITLTPQGTFPTDVERPDFYTASQPVRLYIGPGLNFIIGPVRSHDTGEARFSISVSGYLVDLP